MNKKELNKAISQQLNTLNNKLEDIRNTIVDSTDNETWDPDHYSELQTNLETALILLKDQVVKGKVDEFGDPIIINKGILTLLDEWKEETKEYEDE